MENLQGQFQKGLSSVQKGLKEGKDKIQATQELMSLKLKVSEKEAQRSKLIGDIGEIAYMKIRKGDIDSADFNQIIEQLKEADKYIYNNLKVIEEKTKVQNQGTMCECGTSISSSDKFCVSCGKKVETVTAEILVENITCTNCEENIQSNSSFCNCCGHKIG